MELQLKSVKFSEHMSEETNAFTADVFFRGKKVGYAKNDGRGGCTWISAYPEMRNQLIEAEEYAKTLPSIETQYKKKDGSQFIIESNLEVQVDEMFNQWLDKKLASTNSNKGVWYEAVNGVRYIRSWKGHSIAQLKKTEQGATAIQIVLDRIVDEGGKVLNTNLQGFKF